MSVTNLDDDGPEPDTSFEALPPAKSAPAAAPPIEASDELALVSAVLGDPDGACWSEAKSLPTATLSDPAAKSIWTALHRGVDAQDLFKLAEKTKLPIPRLLQIAELDRAGATFRLTLKRLRDKGRHAQLKELAGNLAEHPDLAEAIAPRIAALASATEVKLLPVVPATEFRMMPRTDQTCLLGNRYLNRGDGAVLVGNSGMGKSSMMLQMAVLFALGRPAFGVKPNGSLKSLIIQSEDSEGDIAEVMASIVHMLELKDEALLTVKTKVLIVTDRIHRGASFIREVGSHLKATRPDLVWVNPLAAFVDGDISAAVDAGRFLREQLNGLNHDCSFGWMIVHHTTKPPSDKGKGETKWNEAQYGMAGSYEVISWARAIMVLRASAEPGEFDLILAKRGTRADVRVETESESGTTTYLERTTTIPLKHAIGFFKHPQLQEEIPLVFWEGRTALKSDLPGYGRPKKHNFEMFTAIWPTEPAKALGLRVLHRQANEIRPSGLATFALLVEAAVTDKLLVRDNTNPRQPKYYRPAQAEAL